MSWGSNWCDNAVTESSFPLLKWKWIRRKIYHDWEEARQDVFDYIELFYNPKRRYGHVGGLAPVAFEKQYFNRQKRAPSEDRVIQSALLPYPMKAANFSRTSRAEWRQ
jgi:hypothetical protein